MDGADFDGTSRVETATLRELAELTERQGWVHHVVDVDTAEVITTPLDRPLAPLSRAQRLSRLGHRFDPAPWPWGPRYRLSPRSPYQAVPLNWLSTYDANITIPDGEDLTHWSLPEDLQLSSDLPGLRTHFDQPPQQRCVASLVFAAYSWAGAVGHTRIEGSANSRIPFPATTPNTPWTSPSRRPPAARWRCSRSSSRVSTRWSPTRSPSRPSA
jgi:hypothetical protein